MNQGIGHIEDNDEMPELFGGMGGSYRTLAPERGPTGPHGLAPGPQPQNWGITQSGTTWAGPNNQSGAVIVSNTSGVATSFNASELLAK